MKYALAAWWILLTWCARKLRMPKRTAWELEDQATLRMFACSLDFEPVRATAKPTTKD